MNNILVVVRVVMFVFRIVVNEWWLLVWNVDIIDLLIFSFFFSFLYVIIFVLIVIFILSINVVIFGNVRIVCI